MNGIAVTGANGFIGAALLSSWEGRLPLRAAVRSRSTYSPDVIAVGDIDGQTDWSRVVDGMDAVIHCAGRAHILADTSLDPLSDFRKVNVDATLGLATAAVRAGVKRFVFVSSVAVMGDAMRSTGEVRLCDVPQPNSAYGQSKYEAELALAEIASGTPMELFVVRPPMVYGAGAPANFQRLVRLVQRRIPLPLGAVRAPRSFVGIDNLADMLWTCATNSAAIPGIYFASDGCDISTADFIRRIGLSLNRAAILIPVPITALRFAGTVLGRQDDVARLINPLRVDDSANSVSLRWKPLHTIENQLAKALAGLVTAQL